MEDLTDYVILARSCRCKFMPTASQASSTVYLSCNLSIRAKIASKFMDFRRGVKDINPFTPESDQCQNSPPAPPEILHHTVRRA